MKGKPRREDVDEEEEEQDEEDEVMLTAEQRFRRFNFWSFTMNRSVCRSVGRLVGLS